MPPVPQSIQSEAEVIDQDKKPALPHSQMINSANKLMKKYQQSNFDITQSLKGQKELPPSLNYLCKSFNTEDTYVSFFIEPPKGQEAI